MIFWKWLTICAVNGLLVVCVSAKADEITVKREYFNSDGSVTLQDLLTEQVQGAESVIVIERLLPGQTLKLPKYRLQKVLQTYGYSQITASNDVVVTEKAVQISTQRYLAIASEYLQKQLKHNRNIVALEPVGHYENAIVNAGKLAIIPRQTMRQSGERQVVWLDFVVDGEVSKSLAVWMKVSTSNKGYKLLRDYLKGEVIAKQDVIFNEWPCDSCIKSKLAASVIGKQLNKDLKQGELIRASDISAPFVVNKDDEISVVVNVGSVTVYRKAVVHKAAALGEMVWLSFYDDDKAYQGIVIKPGLAVLRDSEA